MWIFRSAADGSDRRQDCRRERPITSLRAERSVCATNCKNFARQTRVSERVTELEQILASVHVVDPPDAPSNSVTFGATVTVKDKKGATETLTIVGVDELNFERDAVSWISPLGKALLAADMGDWIKLDDGRSAKIVKIEFKTGQM
jgi:transcription elongation GreA/GreB family factor